MYCGNCKHFSGDGRCLNSMNHKTLVAYFDPMCSEGNIPLPSGAEGQTTLQLRTKTCKWCGRTLPIELFAKNASGYIRVCKDCKREQMRRAGQAKRNH